MKNYFVLLIFLSFFSFTTITEKVENNARPGFYISVEDFTDRSNHEFIVESKDSVNIIFEQFFSSELELGNVDRPITIFNGKRNFYIARVTVSEKPNGELSFRHLKYPNVYVKRSKLTPAVF
ncbi:MAG: hypothetical protein K0M40_05750 [Prolixibacteraceae bacterium]|nr:hypothetical protein [Prolixibacteraceae bacterium]